ncbi:hypothetical protein ACFX5Q_22255 [Mesorhizobium sp. IMUNJ 23033]|uniref:hypothetical protein n=1 Tax=Mesorhizobium sp. IMUNJ 23033 TaxID=3378039 RepID=UPI00384E0A73
MSGLSKRWAGNLFGTNTGNLYCEISGPEKAFQIRLRVMDPVFGLTVYDGEGSFDGTALHFTGKVVQSEPGVATSPIRGAGQLSSKGSITGDWQSELGHAGTFILHPHDAAGIAEAAEDMRGTVHTETRKLGAIRLYRSDFNEIVSAIRKDFKVGQLFVTFSDRKTRQTMALDQFIDASKNLSTIRYLRLNVQERETEFINRVVVVELDADGENAILVQGGQESWARGEADFLKSVVDRGMTRTITSIKRFGLNVNGVMFVVGIAALPDLTFTKRLLFLAVLFALIGAIFTLHKALISNAAVFMNEERPRTLRAYSEQAISVVIATVAGTIAAAAYGALSGNLVAALKASAASCGHALAANCPLQSNEETASYSEMALGRFSLLACPLIRSVSPGALVADCPRSTNAPADHFRCNGDVDPTICGRSSFHSGFGIPPRTQRDHHPIVHR